MSMAELRNDLNARQLLDARARDYQDAVKTRLSTSPSVPPELSHIHTKLPWCRLAVSALEERLDIKEITALNPRLEEWLREFWKANHGDEKQSVVATEALAIGRAYAAVTPSDTEYPLIQVIPADQMVHKVDVYTGQTTEALRVYGANRERYAYYSAGSIEYRAIKEGRLIDDPGIPVASVSTVTDQVPVFAFLSRPEIDDRWGRPETRDIWSLQDASTRAMTDLSVASTLMAVPQRVLTDVSEDDLIDEAGNAISPSKLYMSRLLVLSNPGSGVTQFQAAQLQNFTTAINSMAREAASLMGLPSAMFGITSDANPTSGDSQREGDQRIVRRVERIGRAFKPRWLALLQYAAEVYGEFPPEDIKKIDVVFRNPSTPTIQSQAAATLQLASSAVSGEPLFTRRYLLKELGLTDEQIDQMDAEEQDRLLHRELDEGEDDTELPGSPSFSDAGTIPGAAAVSGPSFGETSSR